MERPTIKTLLTGGAAVAVVAGAAILWITWPKNYRAIGKEIAVDSEMLGESGDWKVLGLNHRAGLAEPQGDDRMLPTPDGGPIDRVIKKYGPPQEVKGSIYWYGQVGLETDHSGRIRFLRIRKRQP